MTIVQVYNAGLREWVKYDDKTGAFYGMRSKAYENVPKVKTSKNKTRRK